MRIHPLVHGQRAPLVLTLLLGATPVLAEPSVDSLQGPVRQTFRELDLLKVDPSSDLLSTEQCSPMLSPGDGEYHAVEGLSMEDVRIRAVTRARLSLENRPPDASVAQLVLEDLTTREIKRVVDARAALEKRLDELERKVQTDGRDLEALRAEIPVSEAKLEKAKAAYDAAVAERDLRAKRVLTAQSARLEATQTRILRALGPKTLVVCGKPEELEAGALAHARGRALSVLQELKKGGLLKEPPEEWLGRLAFRATRLMNETGFGLVSLEVAMGGMGTLGTQLPEKASATVVDTPELATTKCGLTRSPALDSAFDRATNAPNPELSGLEGEIRRLSTELATEEKELSKAEPAVRVASDALDVAKSALAQNYGQILQSAKNYRDSRKALAEVLACAPVPFFRPDQELHPADDFAAAGAALQKSVVVAIEQSREGTLTYADRLIRAHLKVFGGEARVESIRPKFAYFLVIGVEVGSEPLTKRPTFAVKISTWSQPGLSLRRPRALPSAVSALPPAETRTMTGTVAPSSPLAKAQVHINRGLEATRLRKMEEARDEYLACLREIDHAPCHRWLGDVFIALERPEHAKHHYERYITLNPYAPDAPEVRERLDALSTTHLPKGVIVVPANEQVATATEPTHAGLWLSGIGGALLLGGATAVILAATQLEDQVMHAPTPEKLDSALGTRTAVRTLGLGGIGIGALILGGGLYLTLFQSDDDYKPSRYTP